MPFTEPIVVEALKRILDGRRETAGVIAAGEILDAEDSLRSLPFAQLSLEATRRSSPRRGAASR